MTPETPFCYTTITRRPKYRLTAAYEIECPRRIARNYLGARDGDEVEIKTRQGPLRRYSYWLCVPEGYEWDGPSGPTLDTEDAMRASLVHDACYGMIREGRLSAYVRSSVDWWFREILKQDSMSWPRRWGWWIGVRLFGKRATER